MSVQWGDVATWISAVAAGGAMVVAIVQARGARHSGDFASKQAITAKDAAEAANRHASAADRAASAAEEQAQAQREQADIMRQQLHAQEEVRARPQISVEPGPPAALGVVPLIVTHNGGADLERIVVEIEGTKVRGYSTESATNIIGLPPSVELRGMSHRDHRTVWVDIGGSTNVAIQVAVTLTCVEAGGSQREWQLPRKTVHVSPVK